MKRVTPTSLNDLGRDGFDLLEDVYGNFDLVSSLKDILRDNLNSESSDDFSADTHTTGRIEINGPAALGEIEFWYDEDWFQISVEAGDEIIFSLEAEGISDFTQLHLYNDNGLRLAVARADDDLRYSFLETGTFYIGVRDFIQGADRDNEVSSYALTAQRFFDDYAGTFLTDGRLSIPDDRTEMSVTGIIDYYEDPDWFVLDVEAGDVIRFTGSTDADGWQPYSMSLVTETGASIDGIWSNKVITFDSAQTVYLSVLGYGVGQQYTITAERIDDDLPSNASTPAVINTGISDASERAITGRIDFEDDRDWVRVDLTAGDIIAFELSSPSGKDIRFQILDETGNVVDYALSGGIDIRSPQILIDEDVTYFIDLFGEPGDYVIDARTVTDDHGDDIANSTRIDADGQQIDGSFDHNADTDVFQLDLDAGQRVVINLAGAASWDTHWTLYDGLGNSLGSSNSPSDVEALIDASEDGSFFLELVNTDNAPLARDYSFSVTDVTHENPGDLNTPDALIVDGGAVFNALEYSQDRDWFSVAVDSPGFVRFSVGVDEGRSPYALVLYDRLGNEITANRSLSDKSIIYYFETPGEYFIGVEERSSFSQARYELSAETYDVTSPLASILWGTSLPAAASGTTTINVFFEGQTTFGARTIEGFHILPVDWTTFEINQVLFALDTIEQYIDVEFVQVDSADDADLTFVVDDLAPSYLWGLGVPPDFGSEAGTIVLFRTGEGWESSAGVTGGLEQGGQAFTTVIHEIGHALGLAHPHDTGGTSEIIRGHFESGRSDYRMNQSVFTIMSYVHGYVDHPGGVTSSTSAGWAGTLAPLDIAALQSLYGATRLNDGDTIYRLDDGPNARHWYEAIWDTSGIDVLTAEQSSQGVVISLEAANLQYLYGGGGTVSYVSGIIGGYTIAAGTEIENAVGSSFDDVITGGLGINVLEGREGRDSLNGLSGDDSLYGDPVRALLPDSFEAQVYRAYVAVLGREPDAAGLQAYLDALRLDILDQGGIVAEFVGSSEFQATYGDLDNEAFVQQLYRNVFDREADAAGLEAYLSALDSGALSRTEVVLELANSAEFLQLTTEGSGAFGSSVALDPAEGVVYRLYQAVFDRAPDLGGFTAYVNGVQAGAIDLLAIAAEFVASAEFQATYGALSNADFVELLYANVLPGNADQVGRDSYTASLDAGTLSRTEMVLEFAQSFEFIQATDDGARDFRDTIFTDNADRLDGGTGNDVLFGGRGEDTFVFDAASGGQDIILDFTSGSDVIELTNTGTSFDTFDEIMAAAIQDGNDTLIDFGDGHTLRLNNVRRDELSADDFGFPGASSAEKANDTGPLVYEPEAENDDLVVKKSPDDSPVIYEPEYVNSDLLTDDLLTAELRAELTASIDVHISRAEQRMDVWLTQQDIGPFGQMLDEMFEDVLI